MASRALPGIGAALGALIGGATGLGVSKLRSRRRPEENKVTGHPPPKKASAPKSKGRRHEMFGASTRYFTPSSEFFTMLNNLETHLQWPEEREALRLVAENLDNLLGMELLMNGRDPVGRTALPSHAQTAANRVGTLLDDMIAFSQQRRPSETVHAAMLEIRDDVMRIAGEIVSGMMSALAARPITEGH